MTTNSTDNSDEKAGKTSYTTNTTWKLGQEEKKVHYNYESTEESKTETAVTDLITGKQQTIQRNLENGNETVKIGDNISWNATQEEKQGKISYKNGSYLLYTYDDNGNITRISEKSDSNAAESILATYTYDGMSQLLRENNRQANTTTIYSYDTNGNLTESKVYPYTEGNVSGNPTTTHTWNYKNSDWRDLLTEYDGSTITYDAGGNPLTYRNGSNLTWQGGRQLKQYEDSKQTVNYTYNGEGIRTEKTVTDKATGKTVTKNYYLDNSNILAEKVSGSDNDRTIWYAYSGEGKLTGFTYDGADYYYQRNLQDDIIGIYDASGKKVVSYTYDAWGKLTNLTDDSGKNLGEINPFRYRGYYYDEDTSWYYLQSRYYDVEVGRFLNADDVHYLGEAGISCNLFTYCENSPVNRIDSDGYRHRFTIKRSTMATILNGVISLLPYLNLASAFSPISNAVKISPALRRAIEKHLPNILRKISSNGKKIVLCIANKIRKIPWIGKFIGKKVASAVEKMSIQQLLGCVLNASLNRMLSIAVKNIEMATSLGGFLAGMWDYFSDKSLNGKILI